MEEGTYERVPAGGIKEGRFVIIDGVPCKVVQVETSSPGKHGSAKVRITAIGMFDGQKKGIILPSHSDIEVPVLTKKKAQVVSLTDSTVQLMDSETYEVFEVPVTEEFQGKLAPGKEVEVIEAMGRRAVSRVWS
jgi:translation initiation factor 5A